MSLYDKLRHAAANNAERKAKVRKITSKEQLIKVIDKRITTVFIGALDRFENAFGYLWGRGEKNITPEQKKFLYLWKEVRTAILDHGHDQIKLLINKELAPYNIEWERDKAILDDLENIQHFRRD